VASLHRRATVSTLAAEDRLFGRPPSPQSRRRRPRSAAVARLPRRAEGGGGGLASLAADSTSVAAVARLLPTRSRRRLLKTASPAAVSRRPRSLPIFLAKFLRSNLLNPSPLMRSAVGGPRVLENRHGWCGEITRR